jgi:hypothetical protein
LYCNTDAQTPPFIAANKKTATVFAKASYEQPVWLVGLQLANWAQIFTVTDYKGLKSVKQN